MKNKTDIELTDLVKQGSRDSDALSELIKRHSGIFISVINNICPFRSCMEFKDLLEDKSFHIYRSALKYDKSRQTKFCTFLGNEARWLALNLVTYKKKYKTEEMFDSNNEAMHLSTLGTVEDYRKTQAGEALNEALSLAKKSKDKRMQRIFLLRYVTGNKNKVMPWKIIAKKLDLSIQGCINIHNNFIEKIKNKIL